MREHRAKSGKLVYYATRRELETLPGYRGNDRKGRACCPIHNGDNPTALAIDWETGWASCWSCGDAWSIRVEDHPDTNPVPNRYQSAPRNASTAPRRDDAGAHDARPGEHDRAALRANLATAIDTAVERLPGSPGETYLAGRGIPLDVAQALRIGWAMVGTLAGRVVCPLCGPDGLATSATGRAANDHTKPKYKALASDDGYVKTLFNGGAIAQARRSGHPVVVVEGPLDAAACVAAGLPLTVALCGKSYKHPGHFAGVSTVILALDADAAGQEGRRRFWLDLMARGIDMLVLPASALDGAKDLAEYWQRHRALPGQLVARATGPHWQGTIGHPMEGDTPHGTPPDESVHRSNPMDAGNPHGCESIHAHDTVPRVTIGELRRQLAAHGLVMPPRPGELPADLKAEAEALAIELNRDPNVLAKFWADLHQREHQLTREDYIAGAYAVWLAVTFWADEHLVEVA